MNRRIAWLVASLVLCLVETVQAQTATAITTTVCPGAGCVLTGTQGLGTVGLQVTGTFSGTLSFTGTLDGTTFVAVLCTPYGSTTAVTTATSTGAWSCMVAGLRQFRVAFTSFSSGTANISTQTTMAKGGSGGGGGGGGSGTVTQVDTTSPITGGPITTSGTLDCPTCGVTGSPLSQFASTTSAQLAGVISNETGSGLLVFGTSPSLTTPALGVATATSLNGNIFTTGTYTLTGVAAKTLTFNKSLTLDGTDATTMTFPTTSATLARTDAANTFTGHQTIEGVTSTGATGTGAFVFATTPTLVTPVLGVATATSLNGNTFTTGTYTLTGVAGKTLTFNKSLTLEGTDATTMTFPTTSATVARTDAGNTFTGHQTIEGVTSTGATGTGAFVFATTPTLVTPVLGVATATSINGLALTTSTGTLTIANGKTLTASNTLTFTGTDASSVAFGAGGTVLYTSTATTLATGTSVSLSAPRQYYVCTSTCTVTPPVPAAGYEFCVFNDDNVATVITMAALGSSARYEVTARTSYGTASTGTAVSGGAVGDKICLIGLDSTHYITSSYNGVWTVN